jgi:hypothetical protein
MNILDLFPTLGAGRLKTTRNTTWTKKGPGRRHNPLTAGQQRVKDALIAKGMTAQQALTALDVI